MGRLIVLLVLALLLLALLGRDLDARHVHRGGQVVEHGVEQRDFNSYGSRRGNHEVMIRGTFANIRLRNLLLDGVEGSFSALSAFSIARPTARAGVPPPPLTVESLEVRNNILQIKGRSEPGASVTVNGQRVEVQADGSFNEFVTLDKAGAQVVEIRAVGLNGGVMVKRQSVVVAGI